MFRHRIATMALGCIVLLLVPLGAARATITYFFDDFEDGDPMDGSPVTWAPYSGAPAEYLVQDIDDPPDGELEYTMAGTSLTDDWMQNIALDVDVADVSVRTQVTKVQDVPGGGEFMGVTARLTPINDPNVSGEDCSYYWAFINRHGYLGIGSWDGSGGSNDLSGTFVDLDITEEDVLLQFDLVGTHLSLRAWRLGEPMPAAPQVFAIGTTYTSGAVGLFSSDGPQPDNDSIGVFRWVDVGIPPELQSDFDGDGDVDGDDFLVWQQGFGVDDSGDADFDGDTDGDDFLIWQSQFGSSDGAAGAEVPEPAAIVLLSVLAAVGMLSRCTRAG